MEQYKIEFIEFLIEQNVLLFGRFTLKSGRISPYFFNAGQFNTGAALRRLGHYYATAISQSDLHYDILFGPAYKGIPIVATVAIALADQYQIDKPFCFNRKEKKDYGEQGNLIGSPLRGDVLVVDDVVSAGVTFKETVNLISHYPAAVKGLVTAMDREEKGEGQSSAMEELRQQYQIETISVIQLSDVITYLQSHDKYKNEVNDILTYQAQYGNS